MNNLEPALLHSLWQAPLLALGAFLITRPIQRPSDRHKIFLGAIGLTALLPWATFLIFFIPKKVDTAQVVEILRQGMPAPGEPGYLVPGLYLSILAISLVILVAAWRTTRRGFTKGCCEAPDWIRGIASVEARELGLSRDVELRLCETASSPATTGYRRPSIVLPTRLLSVPEGELRSLLAHELAHIKRKDYLFALLQAIATTMAFYQPSVWLLNRWTRDERERACDDIVVEKVVDPMPYALALARIEYGKAGRSLPVLSAAGGGVASRIKRLSSVRGTKRAPKPLLAGALVLGALLCCTGFFFRPMPRMKLLMTGQSLKLNVTPKMILFGEGAPLPETIGANRQVRMVFIRPLE